MPPEQAPPGSRPPVASSSARSFSRVDDFLAGWKPLTPWGRDRREARVVYGDAASIEAILDQGEAWMAFEGRLHSSGREAALDRIAWHLGRAVRLPEGLGGREGAFDLVEIQAVRKFLYNYSGIMALLDGAALAAFAMVEAPQALRSLLDAGGGEGETFAIGSAFDAGLPPLRAAIAAIGSEIAKAIGSRDSSLLQSSGLAFAGRDFLILPVGDARVSAGMAAGLLEVSPWDGLSHQVRPRADASILALEDREALLLAREREVEAEVLLRISAAMAAEAETLGRCVRGLAELDLARSRAALASGGSFVRPIFAAGEDLVIEAGRLAPLESECGEAGQRYTALDLSLSERAALVFGSNMGGKTVALKTVLFLQILAQSGFHLPARSWSGPVYPLIHYVGEGGTGASVLVKEFAALRPPWTSAGKPDIDKPGGLAGGLSGFGREIRSFVEASEWATPGALLAFDEFARTTSSAEAEALLSAILEHVAARAGMKCLFSTHFRGVARLEGVRMLRMRGLDRAAAALAATELAGGGDLVARVNALMRYELIEDSGEDGASDAIAIAELLGLDPRIVARAEDHHRLARLGRQGKRQCRK
ncbi:MAG: MutS-related protein [Rectinemataceae bacterium]